MIVIIIEAEGGVMKCESDKYVKAIFCATLSKRLPRHLHAPWQCYELMIALNIRMKLVLRATLSDDIKYFNHILYEMSGNSCYARVS